MSDTGIGIPKEALPKIFDQFYRVHRENEQIKGTGLGLAIVKKIVEAHGGRVSVDSEVNKGTTFTILLPLLSPSQQEASPETADELLESVVDNQGQAE